MFFFLPHFTEELGAAFIPGAPEAWAPHPLAAYPELAPNAAAIHHTALIQHPALAQVPVRVSYQFIPFIALVQNWFEVTCHCGNKMVLNWCHVVNITMETYFWIHIVNQWLMSQF